jgi:hypothetical protein
LEYQNDPKLTGVIVWPPADGDYTIEINGLYYDVFPDDEDECTYNGGGGEEPSLPLPNPLTGVVTTDRIYGAVVTYSNYWMQEYPNLLIMAAIQQLEYMYKGSKSAERWDKIIEGELVGIEKDAIEEEVSNVLRMEG